MSLKDRLHDARQALSELDFGQLAERLSRKRTHLRARRVARATFRHERDHTLNTIDRLIQNGANPDGARIAKLEHQAKHADIRVGELTTVISRFLERLDELAPKVTRKRKRKHHLLARIRKLRKKIRDQRPPPEDADHFMALDGKTVTEWIGAICVKAREAGYWHGVIVSGFRTAAETIALCRAMCGQDACPGLCGGALSNHGCPPTHTGIPYEGAVDVSDPAGLDRYCQENDLPLIGNGRRLPNDVVHFSHAGN